MKCAVRFFFPKKNPLLTDINFDKQCIKSDNDTGSYVEYYGYGSSVYRATKNLIQQLQYKNLYDGYSIIDCDLHNSSHIKICFNDNSYSFVNFNNKMGIWESTVKHQENFISELTN